MSDEGAQQHRVVTNGVRDQLRLHHQMIELKRREVGQRMTLGVTPNQFDWIQFGGIRRQQVGTHIVTVIGKPTGDGFETMPAQTVPYQSERPAQGTTQLLEES